MQVMLTKGMKYFLISELLNNCNRSQCFFSPRLPPHLLCKMKLTINQQETILDAETTLQLAVAAVGMAQASGIAVAVNNKVVPRARWETHTLEENDKITIIRATQGG